MAIEMLRIVRYGAFALIGVLVLALLAVGLGYVETGGPTPAGGVTKGAPVVAHFKLTDQEGRPVSEKDMLGRAAVVFFGFTFCPDVCPTTLVSLTALLKDLGPDADKLGVYFVTVDPERDGPEALKAYLSSFDPRIRGLTGEANEIAAFAKPLGVYYARVKLEGGGYTMDHTATVFLLDAQGRFVGTIAYGEEAVTAREKLERLVGGKS
jgi:protein SCO1/2